MGIALQAWLFDFVSHPPDDSDRGTLRVEGLQATLPPESKRPLSDRSLATRAVRPVVLLGLLGLQPEAL